MAQGCSSMSEQVIFKNIQMTQKEQIDFIRYLDKVTFKSKSDRIEEYVPIILEKIRLAIEIHNKQTKQPIMKLKSFIATVIRSELRDLRKTMP